MVLRLYEFGRGNKKKLGMYKDFRVGAEYNSLFWQYAHRFNMELNGIDDLNYVLSIEMP